MNGKLVSIELWSYYYPKFISLAILQLKVSLCPGTSAMLLSSADLVPSGKRCLEYCRANTVYTVCHNHKASTVAILPRNVIFIAVIHSLFCNLSPDWTKLVASLLPSISQWYFLTKKVYTFTSTQSHQRLWVIFGKLIRFMNIHACELSLSQK